MKGFQKPTYSSEGAKRQSKQALDIANLSQNSQALLQEIQYNHSHGNYASCISLIRRFLAGSHIPVGFEISANDLLAECLLKTSQNQEALNLLEPLVARFADNDNFKVKLASAYRLTGSPEKSSSILEALLRKFSGNASLTYNYANSLRDEGKHEAALEAYRRAESLGCKSADLYANYIPLLSRYEYNGEARQAIARSKHLHSHIFIYAISIASVLYKLGLFDEAYYCLQQVSETEQTLAIDSKSCLVYSQVFEGIGDSQRAEEYLAEGLRINPNDAELHLYRGNMLQTSGDVQDAIACYEYMLNNCDCDLELQSEVYRRITVCKRFQAGDPQVAEMKQVLTQAIEEDCIIAQKNLYFSLAKVEEDCKDYSASFAYLTTANQLMKDTRNIDFNLEAWMQHAYDMLELDRYLLRSNVSIEDQEKGSGVIFIVGMPRSGSTLTESILSVTPSASDRGETVAFTETLAEFQGDMIHKERVSSELLHAIGDSYLKRINFDEKVSIITDKNLYNWRYAGLISMCLPGARIIHSLRNPVDNMLSIYKAHFPMGNEYAFDLNEIFKVYQLHFQAMKYYKSRHRHSIFTSNYDTLATSPSTYIPDLIARLGLEWDPMYLTPELNTRTVKTASNIQVRSPISGKSVGGWKRYKEHFRPYMERFVELGYEIDS